MSSSLFHLFLFIIATFSISSSSILVLLSGASAIACAFWRLLISTFMLFLFSEFFKVKIKLGNVRHLILFIISGMTLGIHFVLWMDSLFRVPVAISTTIVVAYPIHALLIEHLLLKEKIKKVKIFGLTLGFIGILIYFHDSIILKILDPIGVLESFIASLLAAIYFYVGSIARKVLDIYSYTIPTYLFGSITVLFYSYLANDNILSYPLTSWLWFMALALIPMIGGHTVMNYLLKYYRSSTVTSIAFLEPIGASVLAYVILGQLPKIEHLLVVPLILFGVLLTILSEEGPS